MPHTWPAQDPSFAKSAAPPLANGVYTMQAQLPFAGKSGRHLIHTIWQRSDSAEAFYTCSDVVFGPGGPTGTPSTTPTTPRPGTCTAPEWTTGNQCPGGSLVSDLGHTWKAQWWTQGEEPGTAAAWLDQGTCTPTSRPPGSCTAPVWNVSSIYTGGSDVSFRRTPGGRSGGPRVTPPAVRRCGGTAGPVEGASGSGAAAAGLTSASEGGRRREQRRAASGPGQH